MKIVMKSWLRGVLADMANATPGAGKLTGLYVGLITSPTGTITPETVRTDVTEASYTGYARQSIATWSASYDDADGTVRKEGGAKMFQPSDDVTPNIITGIAYYDAATNGNLVAVDPLASPYPLPDQFSGLPIVPVAALPFAINMGSGVEVV